MSPGLCAEEPVGDMGSHPELELLLGHKAATHKTAEGAAAQRWKEASEVFQPGQSIRQAELPPKHALGALPPELG